MMKRVLMIVLSVIILVGCSSKEYNDVVVNCYLDESREIITSVIYYNKDKTMKEVDYLHNAIEGNHAIKENSSIYSKKN